MLERDGYRCQAAAFVASVACSGPLDVHEVIPRSAWPAGWLSPSNCLTVCRYHHCYISDHPEDAAKVGLHGYSWQRGEDVQL